MPTPANAKASGFIPEIWSARALTLLRNKIVLTRLVRRDTDFTGEFNQGDVLNIPYYGTLTAQDKAAGVDATTQEPQNGETISVKLEKYKYVDVVIPDVVKAQASPALMDSYLEPMVDAIAVALEDDLFALYAAFAQQIGTAGTALSYDTVLEAHEVLNTADVPEEMRSFIFSAKDKTAMLKDPDLKEYFANSQTQGIREGSMGRVAGFDMYSSNRVKKVAGTPNAVKNMAIHRDAIILATRPLPAPPEGAGVQASTINDEASGLSIRTLSQYGMSARGVRVGLDILYGCKKLRDKSGVVVTS